MASFIIEGGHKLSGSIQPQGAKNEALEVISAVLLTREEVVMENIPEILDVKNLIVLLQSLGVQVRCSAGWATSGSRNREGTRSAAAGWTPTSWVWSTWAPS